MKHIYNIFSHIGRRTAAIALTTIAALFCVTQAWASYAYKEVYIDISDYADWASNNACLKVHLYSNANCNDGYLATYDFTAVGTKLYIASWTTNHTINGMKFERYNPANSCHDAWNNITTSSFAANKLIFKITSISGGNWVEGSYSDGSVGLYLNVNGTKTWYTQYKHKYDNICTVSGYNFNNATEINGVNLGIVETLRLDGAGVIGYVGDIDADKSWVAAKIYYRRDNENWDEGRTYVIGNYGFPCNGGDQWLCRDNENHSMSGYNSSTNVNLLSGLSAGEHTIYFKSAARIQYKKNDNDCGEFGYSAHGEVSATFSIVDATVIEGATPITATTSATLCGYLQKYECIKDLYESGFYVWRSNASEATSPSFTQTYASPLKTRSTWTGEVTGLTPGATYRYRPYVKKTTSPEKVFKSSDYYEFTLPDCVYPVGDTIYYTIDASKNADICNLVFPDIASAKEHLFARTSSPAQWIKTAEDASEPNKLLKHVVFQVAAGKYGTGIKNAVNLQDINKWNSSKEYTPDKKFIIRALNADDVPTIYGLDIRNSRNITITNLLIQREVDAANSAFDYSTIIAGTGATSNTNGAGTMTDANIRITNCDIKGKGFCIIHIDDADGLYMENNNLTATRPDYTGDDLCNAVVWGASIKFMNVKNANIQRNNFRGEHATNLLIQGSNHLLFMNNVFWNDNSIIDADHPYLSFIRLLAMNNTDDDAHHLTNIGIYYNTFYLKPNGLITSYKCDYFRLGGPGAICGKQSQQNYTGQYIPTGIEFMYNNCYSRSAVVNGRNSFNANTFLDKSESLFTKIKYNNFWSEYDAPDAEESVFAIGTETQFVKVPDIMCKTVPDDPNGLIIKGGDLNLGSAITTDISGLGAEKVRTDRTGEKNIRPTTNKWTYGAYQQLTSEGEVHVIYWNGANSTDWDNRYNWVKEDGSTLTCVDVLASDLKVVIPDKKSTKYPIPSGGITRYPALSIWTTPTTGEEVRTNIQGSDASGYTADEFAHTIEIEYGGGMIGVEHLGELGSDGSRYTSAVSNFTAPRKRWVLVGAIVNPSSGSGVRYINSGDYFLNHLPEVYMQQVTANASNQIVWGVPFSSLYEDVLPTKCFAIKVPDEYTQGTSRKYPAKIFNARFGTNYDPDAPIEYRPVSGRFINEASTVTYTINGSATNNGWTFLSNTYPANLKPDKLKSAINDDNCSLYVYSYTDGWLSDGNWSSTDYIRPQNGFAVYKTTTGNKEVNLDKPELQYDYTSSTSVPGLRRASADTRFMIRAENLLSSMGSRLSVVYEGISTETLIGVDVDAPVIFVPEDGKRYSTISINDESSILPVSVLNQSGSAFHIKFSLMNDTGFESIVLEDRLENKTYSLTDGETPVFYGLAAGVTEGRFYLNINYAGSENPAISTDIDESGWVGTDSSPAIDIYSRGQSIVVSSAQNTTIEQIYITDMAGRTVTLKPVSSNYSEHTLGVSSGVYTVHVVGSNTTATQKIILK
ncbi:MAG: T9SS type A sorting domain-containing protein [Bacteroidales bacterium]|nr:T9SS type A sorting domain-containing protein [Bacteroidales bacterium]